MANKIVKTRVHRKQKIIRGPVRTRTEEIAFIEGKVRTAKNEKQARYLLECVHKLNTMVTDGTDNPKVSPFRNLRGGDRILLPQGERIVVASATIPVCYGIDSPQRLGIVAEGSVVLLLNQQNMEEWSDLEVVASESVLLHNSYRKNRYRYAQVLQEYAPFDKTAFQQNFVLAGQRVRMSSDGSTHKVTITSPDGDRWYFSIAGHTYSQSLRMAINQIAMVYSEQVEYIRAERRRRASQEDK